MKVKSLLYLLMFAGALMCSVSYSNAAESIKRMDSKKLTRLPKVFKIDSQKNLQAVKKSMKLAVPMSGDKLRNLQKAIPLIDFGNMTTAIAPYAYTNGNGVVLDVLHPTHKATGSSLEVQDVVWTDDILQKLMAKDPNTWLPINVVSVKGHFDTPVSAHFKQLPAGNHTYLLTLGVSGRMEKAVVYVNGKNDSVILGFENDQLKYNPDTSQLRIMFTLKNDVPSDYLIRLLFMFDNKGTSWDYLRDLKYFHHIQLVALD